MPLLLLPLRASAGGSSRLGVPDSRHDRRPYSDTKLFLRQALITGLLFTCGHSAGAMHATPPGQIPPRLLSQHRRACRSGKTARYCHFLTISTAADSRMGGPLSAETSATSPALSITVRTITVPGRASGDRFVNRCKSGRRPLDVNIYRGECLRAAQLFLTSLIFLIQNARPQRKSATLAGGRFLDH
jgi:hypothetical protein